ncbi:MAG: hypothetical protein AABX90_00225 [Nanoarchaeota archaeon]
MELVYLVPVIAFLGMILGIVLNKLATEEIKFGKFGARYFVWMKRIVLFFILISILYLADNFLIVIGFAILGFIAGVFFSEYLFLGISMVIGFLFSGEILIWLSSLVFLYGLPYGSMMRRVKRGHIYLLGLFFIPLVLLFFNIGSNFLIGFVAGGCFNYLIRK